MKHWNIIVLTLLGLLLVACGGGDPTPIPAPPPTNTPQQDAVPTATATEAVVELPVVPTMPPLPTSTALPPSTPDVATAVPTATDTILITAADFGTDRNPLTGEIVDNPENLQRRPLNVKISNAPASYTRPQAGLNDADWVFEHTAEGNLTRFSAIFYSKTPERIGPIRSARLIDLELPAMFDAALVFSGSSDGVRRRLNESDFSQRILYGWEPGYYRTGEDKPYEHTLYTNPAQLWLTLGEKGQNVPPEFVTFNSFSEEAPVGGIPTSKVTANYDWTIVDWVYDPIYERYERWSDGQIHADGNTYEQVVAKNVVIMSPFHTFDGKICEQLNLDNTCASYSVEIQLWGSGPATILRDGNRYDVIWHREGRNDTLTFTDSEGNPFPLKIGNTWVQLIPSWLKNPVTYTS